MKQVSLPGGETRISEAVVDAIAMTAAREVHHVLDIVHIAKGAVIGGTLGALVGLAGGGAGAVIGGSTGSVAGAAVAHLIDHRRHQKTLYSMDKTIDTIQLHLSAEYGADLIMVAEDVRRRVSEALYNLAGFDVGQIEVVITDVINIQRPLSHIHSAAKDP